MTNIPSTCPYCKINFIEEPWAARDYPKVICWNCKNYGEYYKRIMEEDKKQPSEQSTNILCYL